MELHITDKCDLDCVDCHYGHKTGLTIDFCKKVKASYILRGLRTSVDFEFERSIGQMNKNICPEIETIFLLTAPELTPLCSSIVRDIHRNGGDVKQFVPKGVDLK